MVIDVIIQVRTFLLDTNKNSTIDEERNFNGKNNKKFPT